MDELKQFETKVLETSLPKEIGPPLQAAFDIGRLLTYLVVMLSFSRACVRTTGTGISTYDMAITTDVNERMTTNGNLPS